MSFCAPTLTLGDESVLYGNIQVGLIFEFVKSIGAMLRSFSALKARGHQ
jgi:hypothetical protein